MPDMNKKTILVVDDDHEIVRAITITLEREGYHVLNAYDGLQALDCVTSREVHLIIIDVMIHGRGRLHFEAVQPDGACGAGEIAAAALH